VIVFLRQFKLRALFLSFVILVPCVWHRHIEAGDLGSHVYNAWLAQLIEKGQAPGLYLAKQWNNILFDVTLMNVAKVAGLAVAEKIVVAACVLVFFWGVFAFVTTVSEQPAWMLTPCLAMLAYGYSFEMGFMNYYVSMGLACFGLAVLWRAQGRDWIAGLALAALTYLAHPIGFLWMLGVFVYVRIRGRIPGWWKLVAPMTAVALFYAVRWYAASHPALAADWDRGPFYFYNGADQLGLHGERYFWLAGVAFFCGVICVMAEVLAWWKKRPASRYSGQAEGRPNNGMAAAFALPLELYIVALLAVELIPENLKPSMSAGLIGILGSRLTTMVAIFGLTFLGRLQPRRWHLVLFGGCAVVFFAFLYQDSGWLNEMEANAEQLVGNLPQGTRVVVNVSAPADWRILFIGHAVERACIGHCFSYANYEPSSGQFRVRVKKGSAIATDSADDSEDMASGTYEVQDTDPPLKLIYQCDPQDLRKLCLKELAEGELTSGGKATGN
jgi:hypothetical protein